MILMRLLNAETIAELIGFDGVWCRTAGDRSAGSCGGGAAGADARSSRATERDRV